MSTFWRRFLLLETADRWPTSRLRRQPELAHIPPDDPYFSRRARVQRLLRRDLPELALIIAGITVYWVMLGLLARISFDALSQSAMGPRMHPWIAAAVAAFAVLQYGVIALVIRLWDRARTRRARLELRTELRSRSIPVCLACGYVGGDMSAPRCPECGAENPMP